ncbi:MAG TPA: cytochrome c3 family protein [Pirellulales bacterium]|nr:cytochrome c3 family protein [Pirellulales bacterium]
MEQPGPPPGAQRSHRLRRFWLVLAGSILILGVAGTTVWLRYRQEILPSERADPALFQALPRMRAVSSFVASQECRDCHPREYSSWHDSFHRQMTQVARPDTVLGPFDGTKIEDGGQVHQPVRRGDELWLESSPAVPLVSQQAASEGEGTGETVSARTARRVVMTTGAHHMQLFWSAGGDGNLLDELPVVYLRDERPGKSRWAPLEASFLSPTPPGFASQAHWNRDCILCHATGGKPGLSAQSGPANTKVAELGIACEACHGPGERHVALHRSSGGGQSHENTGAGSPESTDQHIVNPARLPPERSAQVCGYCHAMASFVTDQLAEDFLVSGGGYRPGDDLSQVRVTVLPSRLSDEQLSGIRQKNPFFDGSYWPDGMIRVAGREYNALLESACRQGGMTCLSCHSMHQSKPDDQLALGKEGNEACYQCHASYRENLTEHTRHLPDSTGSQCYNCHMPHTTYGLFKAIRSHQISSPSVAATLKTGRPNACNLCHLDRTLSWTAQQLSSWYQHPAVALDDDQRSISAAALLLLSGNPLQRALLSWGAGWAPALEVSRRNWLPPLLAILLDDPSPVMRRVASQSLVSIDSRYAIDYDFCGPAQQRRAAREHVLQIWADLTSQQAEAQPAGVLIEPDGTSNEGEIERLLRQRDDRGLPISE